MLLFRIELSFARVHVFSVKRICAQHSVVRHFDCLPVQVEVMTVSVATQRRAVLEAIAFGSFLRDVETYVDTEYQLLTPSSSASGGGGLSGFGPMGGPDDGPDDGGSGGGGSKVTRV